MAEKSWRNAELVVYAENLEKEAFWTALNDTKVVTKFAWVLHDKDEGKVVHAHFELQFKTPLKTSTICNKFGVRENQLEKIKGTWADAIDYLTHHNAPTKHQYDPTEVHANYDWTKDAQNSKASRNARKQEIIAKISSGEIRRYNETDMITAEEYDKYYQSIVRAYKYRDSYVLSHLEMLVEMKNVAWIYGQPGTGKTTFAKQLAKSAGFFYRLTSTGQHMFDEYQDEPCIVMDDLRAEDIKFVDLLGILDPYNFKSAAARYKNKPMQAELIVVTSTKSPEQFCRSYGKDELTMEDERQLYRRIAYVYEVTESTIYESEYEDDNITRKEIQQYPNLVLVAQKRKRVGLVQNAVANMMENYIALA